MAVDNSELRPGILFRGEAGEASASLFPSALSTGMDIRNLRVVAAGIGASAAIMMGVLGVGFGTAGSASADGAPSGRVPTPQATTGQTVTNTTPPAMPAVSEAKPALTGPAPLPSEEQGLPG
jgi:hypothetical protein